MGRHTDSKLKASDLSQEAIKYFKEKAVIKGRLSKEDVAVPDDILMENLHLIDENGYLIRAAMLAFLSRSGKMGDRLIY